MGKGIYIIFKNTTGKVTVLNDEIILIIMNSNDSTFLFYFKTFITIINMIHLNSLFFLDPYFQNFPYLESVFLLEERPGAP